MNHSNPNAKLLPFVGKTVEAHGTVYQKGGLTGLFVETAKEATP